MTYLDPCFGLVHVSAATRLSRGLLEHLDWNGATHTAVLLLACGWDWSSTSFLDPERRSVRLVLPALTLVSLMMSSTLSEAFSNRAAIFVGAWLTLHIGRHLHIVIALRGTSMADESKRPPGLVLLRRGALDRRCLRRRLGPSGAVGADPASRLCRRPPALPGHGRYAVAAIGVSNEHLLERWASRQPYHRHQSPTRSPRNRWKRANMPSRGK
ncbi:low temperature requirement protein A [Streptomyces sp. NPDC001255]|uniref:low temperature requirement protein A n=1 Tax=Streptomyces sp. NPDC001255 TaxID=3364550 RepID=UPI0036C558AE